MPVQVGNQDTENLFFRQSALLQQLHRTGTLATTTSCKPGGAAVGRITDPRLRALGDIAERGPLPYAPGESSGVRVRVLFDRAIR